MTFASGLAQGFVTGYKTFDEDDIKYKKLRNKMIEAQTANISDPEMRKAKIYQLLHSGDWTKANLALLPGQIQLQQLNIKDAQDRAAGTGQYSPTRNVGDITGGQPAPTTAIPQPNAAPDSSVTPADSSGNTPYMAKGGPVPEQTVSRLSNQISRGTAIPPKRNMAGINPTNFSAGGSVTEGRLSTVTHGIPGSYAEGGEVGSIAGALVKDTGFGPKPQRNFSRDPWNDPFNGIEQPTLKPAKYAEGGDVEGDEDETPPVADADEDEAALPENSQLAVGRMFSMLAAHDAVRTGLLGAQNMVGLGRSRGMATPQSQQAYMHYAQGLGAANPQEVQAIKDKIDPDHKMPEDQRNLAALSKIWTFYMRQGNPQEAQRAATALVQNYRVAAAHYGALAAVAVQKGDLNNAAQMAMKAYDNVPDGRNIKVGVAADGKHLNYTYTDENGNVINKGLANPDELAQKVSGLGSPQKFDALIMDASGMRQQGATTKGTKGTGGGGMKVPDYAKADELVGNATPTDKDNKQDPALKNDALKLFTNPENRKNNLTHYDAVDIAKVLRTADDKTGVMRDKDYEGPGVKIRVPISGDKFRDVYLTDEQWERYTTSKAQQIKTGDTGEGTTFFSDVLNGMQGKPVTPGGFMDKLTRARNESMDRLADPRIDAERANSAENLRGAIPSEELPNKGPADKEADLGPTWAAARASSRTNPNLRAQQETAIPSRGSNTSISRRYDIDEDEDEEAANEEEANRRR